MFQKKKVFGIWVLLFFSRLRGIILVIMERNRESRRVACLVAYSNGLSRRRLRGNSLREISWWETHFSQIYYG